VQIMQSREVSFKAINRRLLENLFDDVKNLLFGQTVSDCMVRLNLHRISDASQYLFLNRTKHRLRWFPIWFAAIRANRAASLMACSTFGITTRFSCQLFSPRDYRLSVTEQTSDRWAQIFSLCVPLCMSVSH
jgi:hypothetical protein